MNDDHAFLTVPGYGNSGPQHWHTVWEQRHGWLRVEQDDFDAPLEATWLPRLQEVIERQARPVVLVAHSCGSAAVGKWAARYASAKVAAAFLVAPADTEQPGTLGEVAAFGPMALERLPFPSLVVASTNDPFVTTARAEAFARAWGSELEWVQNAGHLNTDSGHGPWPEGEAMLQRWLGRVRP